MSGLGKYIIAISDANTHTDTPPQAMHGCPLFLLIVLIPKGLFCFRLPQRS